MNTDKRVATKEQRRELTPPVDIFDQGEAVVLLADMPGIDASRLEINYDRGQLTVHGHAAEGWADQRFTLQEFQLGDYHREFTIGDEIDPTGISAELKHGVLRLTLPKVKERKPMKIKVKSH